MNRSDLSTINFNDIYVDYDWAAKQPERYEAAINIFEDNFGTAGDFEIYSAPGRTEIGGNHTDHQHDDKDRFRRPSVPCGRGRHDGSSYKGNAPSSFSGRI